MFCTHLGKEFMEPEFFLHRYEYAASETHLSWQARFRTLTRLRD